ncbi:hypothetical protein JOQ06_021336 [Pogonophryne albipinna]|uniref:Uncharacterized protein n=1 Tax=Pogonophryne albipinna TaxID=1090488 RepID=A0AAD6F5W2_9TELE|nr:hypothetical protein JOQ06_021336 [Pogonophryne albipinna]
MEHGGSLPPRGCSALPLPPPRPPPRTHSPNFCGHGRYRITPQILPFGHRSSHAEVETTPERKRGAFRRLSGHRGRKRNLLADPRRGEGSCSEHLHFSGCGDALLEAGGRV